MLDQIGWNVSPLDRVLHALRFHGSVVQHRNGSARCTCPVHRDARPSLVVTERDGRVLLRCFAGCRTADVLNAIGLRFADLFGAGAPRVHRHRVAEYVYTDLHGTIIAQKVRFEPKAFCWERPDATARTGWRSGTNGVPLPLYRWPELIDARHVVLVEGEKGADALRARGFVATCPPSGAATWQDRWTDHLSAAGCDRLIVLPDNDREGVAHARRVALACCTVMRVAVITLPDLPAKGDVVDFFEQGNTASELRWLIDGSPDWSPDTEEDERKRRKREQTRERVRRHRAKQNQQRNAVNDSSAA